MQAGFIRPKLAASASEIVAKVVNRLVNGLSTRNHVFLLAFAVYAFAVRQRVTPCSYPHS